MTVLREQTYVLQHHKQPLIWAIEKQFGQPFHGGQAPIVREHARDDIRCLRLPHPAGRPLPVSHDAALTPDPAPGAPLCAAREPSGGRAVSDALVEARGLVKRWGDVIALDDVDLTVERGEVVTVVGPSGSGKSTLLRCLNGLEIPDEGTVRVAGRTVRAGAPDIDEVRARIGMFDRFHVAQYLGKEVDQVRRQGHRQLIRQGDERMKGSKYQWLRNRSNMTWHQQRSFTEDRKGVGDQGSRLPPVGLPEPHMGQERLKTTDQLDGPQSAQADAIDIKNPAQAPSWHSQRRDTRCRQ